MGELTPYLFFSLENTNDPVLAHEQLKNNLADLQRKIKLGKFEKKGAPKGAPLAKKARTEHGFSEDEFENDLEDLIEPHVTKKLVDAYLGSQKRLDVLRQSEVLDPSILACDAFVRSDGARQDTIR